MSWTWFYLSVFIFAVCNFELSTRLKKEAEVLSRKLNCPRMVTLVSVKIHYTTYQRWIGSIAIQSRLDRHNSTYAKTRTSTDRIELHVDPIAIDVLVRTGL